MTDAVQVPPNPGEAAPNPREEAPNRRAGAPDRTAGYGTEVRVRLPTQLRELATLPAEVRVQVAGPVTQRAVLDALEGYYPVLKGTIRDRVTAKRRPFIRFYACEEDYSNAAPDDALPEDVACGRQPFFIVGAMAGG